MIHYNKIGLTEGIDLSKSKNSTECIVCHYWYFNNGLRFQKLVCNACHDLLMMRPDINNKTIRYIIYDVSKSCLLESFVVNDHEFI